MKKYCLHPGTIRSKNDGDVYFIGSRKLAALYRVPFEDCVIVDYSRPETYQGRYFPGMIHLYPRDDGNYNLES